MAEPVVVDLLRHGEVEGEVSMARGCRTDVALTEAGWRQMQAVGSALADAPLGQVATSPMARCRAFAERFSSERELPLMVLDGMREVDFGHWEGKTAEEIGDAELLTRFLTNPAVVAPPGGESFALFSRRVIDCWHDWLADAAGEQRLLVAHGGVIRVILSHLLEIPAAAYWRLALPYGAWCRVSLLEGEQPRILFLNREVA